MKKTVIMNVCSLEDPSFYVRGGIDLSDNKIKAKRELAKDYKNGRSAYIAYNIPEEYHGKAYVVDVDHINKSSSAGVIIGAKSRVKVEDPEYFLGYSCEVFLEMLLASQPHAQPQYFALPLVAEGMLHSAM